MSTPAPPPPQGLPDESILLRQDDDHICTLTLNRPDKFNALSEDLLDALQRAFDELAQDNSVRVIILAARGKAFCAGHDLKEMRANRHIDYYKMLFKKCSDMMLSMIALPQPVIARVQGVATAAGCQLVANADMAVASTEASFGTSGINVGLFCMTPGVALSRNLGRKQAFEMLFTGDIIGPDQALEFGLVNRVVTADRLDRQIERFARSIVGKSRAAVAAGKKVYYRQLEQNIKDAYAYASDEMACNMMFHDAAEGIDAFIGKRKPV
ncbi:MAG TPA: enoyl-CoA hydratase, partial [Rhodospirillales bacterium]|nr:enoyl-CoA hydratase [Rhodospirillales bacterium]